MNDSFINTKRNKRKIGEINNEMKSLSISACRNGDWLLCLGGLVVVLVVIIPKRFELSPCFVAKQVLSSLL